MRILLMGIVAACILFACDNNTAESKSKDDSTAKKSGTMQSEFADAKYTDMGKASMVHFAKGDYEAWAEQFDENVVYSWSSGDSLTGKAAVVNYWKERRKLIDSVTLSNDIWLPIKINVPQRGPDMPGVWTLQWQQVDVKYKNGKKLMFWVHTGSHYNKADKVDRVITYMDRAPINKALGK